MDEDKKLQGSELIRIDCREAIVSEDFADLIVAYEGNITQALIDYNAICYQIINENVAVLHTSLAISIAIGTSDDIRNIPRLLGPYGTLSVDRSGILPFHTHPYIPLRGTGVIIGFVDSGIDYTNPAFIKRNNTSKILSIWDQTIQEGLPPSNFQYGTEYTNNDINIALQSENPYEVVPSIDETGHGTFLAGIAAGVAIDDTFVGAAPEADVIMVKLKPGKKYIRDFYLIEEDAIVYQDNDIIMGIQYLVDKAASVNRPLVICLGIGTNLDGHDGTSLLEEFINTIGDITGKAIIVAAGNEANLRHHFTNVYPYNTPYQDTEVIVGGNERGLFINIWAQAPDIYSIAILSPTGEFISRVPPIERWKEYTLWLERTEIYIKYISIEPRTGSQLILIRIKEPTEGVWTLRIIGEVVVVGQYSIYLDREGWILPTTSFFISSIFSTVTVPGTAKTPITVGAYNHYDESLYISSGRGPTRAGVLKPELVAPGVNVIGPLPFNQLGVMTGTSVAAAHVAGAAALLFQWGIVLGNNPQMNTRAIKQILIRGAERKGLYEFPNNLWGYGMLNLFRSFEILRGRRS
ncbi:subtilase family protein [Natranaerovirga pectinivora]|uniref:Subtilase family protein n=1 Tax=Natranaerovirga pectinivora TaxID=682400 RepID=A0A4R3MRL5_9FIRM|nr:S8 family peptidase [Natranaerovirga pectinivora]TCT17153.1 subtilase family protein [Natranaerovirga pectinivora]